MRKEETTCDIQGCGKPALFKGKQFQVIFTTDQTEGRSVKPYLSVEKFDLCSECYDKLLKGYTIYGSGAQGYNTYWFTEPAEPLRVIPDYMGILKYLGIVPTLATSIEPSAKFGRDDMYKTIDFVAAQTAIGFSNWIIQENWEWSSTQNTMGRDKIWFRPGFNLKEYLTTGELFALFLKQRSCEFCKEYDSMDTSTKCPECGRTINISFKKRKS